MKQFQFPLTVKLNNYELKLFYNQIFYNKIKKVKNNIINISTLYTHFSSSERAQGHKYTPIFFFYREAQGHKSTKVQKTIPL